MSCGFYAPLDVEQIDGEHWRLLAALNYVSDTYGSIIVPAGFVTDFASTPQIVWSIGMPKSGIYDCAAVVHDYLYVMGGLLTDRTYTKVDADAIFNEAMGVLGVGRVKRYFMYQAVKWFGRGAFPS